MIEDDDATAKLISIALTEAGMKWWRYSNGAGAASALAGEHPSLRARVILLDLDLPAVNGYELIGVLQRDGTLEATKVICVTGNHSPEAEEQVRALGATQYVTKPFLIDDLVRAVQTALGR